MAHVHFTFPAEVKRELGRLVPHRERSQFVARATGQALQTRLLKKVLLSKRFVGTYPSSIGPERWVREVRRRGRKIPLSE